MAKSKKWMSKAFANSHGQFKAKAARAGETTRQFAHQVLAPGSHATTKTKRQAALAERGMAANHKGGGRKKFSRHYERDLYT
jgi:hypothetical protein